MNYGLKKTEIINQPANKMKKLFLFTLLIALISLFLLSRVSTSRVPPSVFAGYCGDGTCGAGEDCYNCSGDCPTCPPPPQPSPGVTPTPGPGGTCAICGGGVCSNGIPYDLICCCGWDMCGPCEHGNVVDCWKQPDCSDTIGCSIPENCPNISAAEACGSAACNVAKKCVDGVCVWECQGLPPCDGEPSGNVPPFIQRVTIDPPLSICQATPGETVTLTATYGDNNGVGDLKRAYLGFAPCGSSGDAYCTNFERNLANYFGGVFYTREYVGSDQVRIAIENYGTTSCTGGASGNCPWGGLRSIGSMSVYNKPGTVEVTNVSVSRGNFTASVTWKLKFHGVPANSYNIYAMVVDMSDVWQPGIGQPAHWWDWYGTLTVEECGISGRVYDSADTDTTCFNLTSKPPVEGAVVTGDLLGDGVYTNTSLGNGSYSLTNLPGGTYAMSAAKDGYRFEGLVCNGTSQLGSFPVPPVRTNINIGISSWADPWFQTQGGDVHGQTGIHSKIPTTATNTNFCMDLDNYPGVVSYEGSADFGEGEVSSQGWLAKTSFSKKSYNYFYSLLGSPTYILSPGEIDVSTLETGVYAYEGDVSLSNDVGVVGTKKIVIITNGKFLIKHRIVIDPGGSLVVIAQGGIGIFKNLIATGAGGNRLQGIFITDGTFYSSVEEDFTTWTPAESEKILVIDGGVIAQSVNLGRDFSGSLEYDNNTTPAETFRYDPSLFMNIHPDLWKSAFTWEELAP